MRRFPVVAIAILLLFQPYNASAENQMVADISDATNQIVGITDFVVTPNRVNTPAREVGSSTTVITEREIEESQQRTVLEVMRTLPALDVVQSGGPGKSTSIFIRGAESDHTLVLIDGIEMNDPSSPGRAFDFSSLTTENIERIEIIRGPQSTLYGSDAIGGVINIITKKGGGEPNGYASLESGSFNTFRGSAGVNGGNDTVNYSLGLSGWKTDGISSASEKDGATENDGYENKSVSALLGATPTESIGIALVLKYIDDKSDIDNGGGSENDDPNNRGKTKSFFLKTNLTASLFDQFWTQRFGIAMSNHDKKYQNDTDIDHPDESDISNYRGSVLKFDWQHNLLINKTNTLTLGVESEEEKSESDYHSESSFGPFSSVFNNKSARTTSLYLQDQIKLFNSWFTTLGARVDDHSSFGSETTYRITTAYLIESSGTKLKGSYGKGFKAPTLFQLFSSYGDENLHPEKSAGWDVGIEQTFFGRNLSVGLTYFSNEFTDLIDFDPATSKYMNIAEAKSNGVELSMLVRSFENVTVRANYTYTNAKDEVTNENLRKRAKNKFGANVNYRFSESGAVNLGLLYVGGRDDLDFNAFPAERVELGAYTLVNVAANYGFNNGLNLFGRIDNLLDEEYEETKGYGTPGVSAYIGASYRFGRD